MDEEPEFLEWLTYAERDLQSAQFLKNMYPVPLEIICFHCQQAAEKAIKALLAFHNIAPHRTHDLQVLCGLVQQEQTLPELIMTDCKELLGYEVVTRYPSKDTAELPATERALEASQRILSYAHECVNERANAANWPEPDDEYDFEP